MDKISLPPYLYRGVSDFADLRNGGTIFPVGDQAEVTAKYDGGITHNGHFTRGPSTDNAARAHQLKTGQYGARCVSTSRSKAIAADYATDYGIVTGWVYVIDESRLTEFGIIAKEFVDSQYDEAEVTLIFPNTAPLPAELILRKYRVDKHADPLDED